MKVTVDLARCQGYANCVVAAPGVFDLDEESGLSTVVEENPGEDRRAAVEQAVRLCPTQAVQVAG